MKIQANKSPAVVNKTKAQKIRAGENARRGKIGRPNGRAAEKNSGYSAGFVLGSPVTRVTVFMAPRLRKRSMRSKRFNTLRFLDDAEPPLLKLLCWDINFSFL